MAPKFRKEGGPPGAKQLSKLTPSGSLGKAPHHELEEEPERKASPSRLRASEQELEASSCGDAADTALKSDSEGEQKNFK